MCHLCTLKLDAIKSQWSIAGPIKFRAKCAKKNFISRISVVIIRSWRILTKLTEIVSKWLNLVSDSFY